jgi:hypothetical protein
MSSPDPRNARAHSAGRRPSLRTTVLQLAAIAAVAAVLVWSVLFIDLLRNHADTGAALIQPAGQHASPDTGQPAPAPAPVTTRSS